MSGAWVDRLGTVAAASCALHCAVLSLAPTLLTVVGLGRLHDERFEWAFVVSAVGFALAAASLGHRRHGAWAISVPFVLGALALVGARVLEVAGVEGGLWLALLGGAVLVGAHVSNSIRCRACEDGTCG